MRAVIFSAALLVSTALLAGAPSASAQQYGSYPGTYGSFGQAAYGPPYGTSYPNGYGGGFNAASPYAGVCAALAYSAATQGYVALATSPYTATCEYLGLMGGMPGAGFGAAYGAGYPGTYGYGTMSTFGQSSGYPYIAGGAAYGAVYGSGYASNPNLAGTYGSYAPFWP